MSIFRRLVLPALSEPTPVVLGGDTYLVTLDGPRPPGTTRPAPPPGGVALGGYLTRAANDWLPANGYRPFVDPLNLAFGVVMIGEDAPWRPRRWENGAAVLTEQIQLVFKESNAYYPQNGGLASWCYYVFTRIEIPGADWAVSPDELDPVDLFDADRRLINPSANPGYSQV